MDAAAQGAAAQGRHAVELKLGALALALLVICGLLQARVDSERGERALSMFDGINPEGHEAEYIRRQNFNLYLPQARALSYASLGHRNVVADMIWLKAAHYVSKQFKGGGRLEWLDKIYNVTVDLDPQWENAYWIGAMVLAAVARQPDKALALLRKGMMRIPESYKLPYEAGVTHLFLAGIENEKAASRYFNIAKDRPGCSAMVKTLVDRLLAETGQLERAIKEAERRVQEFGPDSTLGKVARRSLKEYRSKFLVQQWRRAVARFKEEHGRWPRELREVPTQLVFEDFYGRPLRYVPSTGEVSSEGLKMLKLIEQAGVMNAGLFDVRGKLGRPPADMDEFVRVLRTIYTRREHTGGRLPPQLERVMGSGLEIPAHPFASDGESFRYDAERGEFVLRPERRPESLYEPDEL